MLKLNFVCPECYSNSLEEVVTNRTTCRLLIFDDNEYIQRGESIDLGAEEVVAYRCSTCCFVLQKDGRNITTEEELRMYLKN